MIEILRKSTVALIVLALALVAQMPHAAYVFAHAPNPVAEISVAEWALASAYAIAIESATLMFVLHGQRAASCGFAVASFAVNMSYYAMHGVALWSVSAFPAWLLSALLPIAIASYSHILTQAHDDARNATQSPRFARNLRAWITQHFAQRNATTQRIDAPVQEDATQQEKCNTHDAAQKQQDEIPVHHARARALQMHYEEMSIAEIARILQRNESTVRSWIARNGKKEPVK